MATSLERLQPQLSQQQMDINTWANYEKASYFYELRMNAWKEYMKNKILANNIDLIKWLETVLSTEWQEIFNSYRNNADAMFAACKTQNIHFHDYMNRIAEERFEQDIGLSLLRDWVNSSKSPSGGRQHFMAFLGDYFEKYVTKVMQEFGIALAAADANITQDMIYDFVKQTGNLKSAGATVKGAQNVRPDIIVGEVTYDIKDVGKPAEKIATGNGISIELQGKVKLDEENAVEQLSKIANIYNSANLFGFSVKVWQNSDKKEFAQSSVIADEFHNTFIQTDSKGSRHAWDKDYTSTYVLYKLSTWLVNIIGPTNIGLITGKEFIPFSEWLKDSHVFYMQVQMKNVREKDKTKGLPDIKNNGIYILNYYHKTQKLNTKLKKLKNNNFYTIQFERIKR